MRYALRSRIVAGVAGLWLAGGVGAAAPAANAATPTCGSGGMSLAAQS